MTKQQLISHLQSLSRSLQNLADMLQNLPDIDFDADLTDTLQPPTEISAEIIIDDTDNSKTNKTQDDTPTTTKPDAPKPSSQMPFNPLGMLFGGLKLPNMSNTNTPGANPLSLLNMFGGNAFGNPLGNLLGNAGGLNLPTTLTELHDNPQILNIINQVAANPQTLSMLSQLTGQNPQQLQTMLQGLNPAPAAAPTPAVETVTAAATSETAAATAAATPATPATPAPSAPTDISGLLGSLGSLLGGNLGQQPPAANSPVNIPNNLPANAASAAMQAMPVTPATAHLDNLLAQWHWQPYARVWKM